MQLDMNEHEEIAKLRLSELRKHLAKVDHELHKALPADSEDHSSVRVLDHGMRTVPTAHGFTVPFAPIILVLDGFRIARKFLLRGC